METVITLNTALPAPMDGKPPAWVHLTPAGNFRGRDGRGPFTVDADAVVAASTVPAVIDEMHATDLQGPAGGSAPARGWIVELQARADGVWGRVDWTPRRRRTGGEPRLSRREMHRRRSPATRAAGCCACCAPA